METGLKKFSTSPICPQICPHFDGDSVFLMISKGYIVLSPDPINTGLKSKKTKKKFIISLIPGDSPHFIRNPYGCSGVNLSPKVWGQRWGQGLKLYTI